MSESIIKITEHIVEGRKADVVDARELHQFLGLGKDFSTWVKQALESADMLENKDFWIFPQKGGNPSAGRPAVDYALTVETAKHLCMMSRSSRGREARDYFIECEKRLHVQPVAPALSARDTMVNLLRAAADELAAKDATIAELSPKADVYDDIMGAEGCIPLQALAKILGIGPNVFFAWLREHRILTTDRVPYQTHLNCGRFVVKYGTWTDKNGVEHTTPRTYVTAKGVDYLRAAHRDGCHLMVVCQ